MKIGRNDPCPCGSGKKFKKCCIDKPEYKTTPLQAMAPKSDPYGRDLFGGHHHVHDHGNHDHHHNHDNGHHGHRHNGQGPHGQDHRHDANDLSHSHNDALQTGPSRVNPVAPEFQPLAEAMELGFKALEGGEDAKAAGIWLEGWDWLLNYAEEQEFTSLKAVDDAIRGHLPEFIFNWVQDLEACLGNLAMHDEDWANTRLNMIRDLTQRFPETDRHTLFNMREAEAETLFLLGRADEGDALFADLVRTYPENAWAYIGWGDMYSPVFFKDKWQKDPSRARELYESGLNEDVVEDRVYIEERIRLLDETF